MVTIQLSDLRFYAYHGLYEGESITGSEYEVQLRVHYERAEIKFDSLGSVIDYVELYELVKNRMVKPVHLLEELADNIIQEIAHKYSFVKEINISIFKLSPPIEGFQGKVGVTLRKLI